MANVNQILRYMVSNQLRLIISIIIATVVLVLMQIQYWYGDYGYANLIAVKNQLHEQNRLNQEQINKNNILLADVKDLKSGLSAIEEHARLDLGLIKPGETFIQLSNAPITYSRQPLLEIDESIEAVDSVPEPMPNH
ncbi:FtsB family cell division protein [Moraxella catarrhalis]|uniref:FtsB family cell division protein n=1 Tax=Moraxella catarrhalis TaxID=480 RepID=UPI00139348EA|nr:septum formation initiator family protein [Moraxella catarrhalis]MPX73616.1 cell division protein FtsB [Moraxella catarrhalis]